MKHAKTLSVLAFALLGAGCPGSAADLPEPATGVGDVGGVGGPAVADAVILQLLGGDDGGADAAGGGGGAGSDDAVLADGGGGSGGGGGGGAADGGGTAVDAGAPDGTVPSDAGGGGADIAAVEDVAAIDVGGGSVDVGSPTEDVGPAPVDAGPPDVGGASDTATCLALLGSTCDKIAQCAGEVPFGGDQLAQYASQCDDIVASQDGESGCAAAGSKLDGVTPAEAEACVSTYDCGFSGIGAIAQALFPLFQAAQQGGDVAGEIPGAVDVLLKACN